MERSAGGAAMTELILETFRLNGLFLEAGSRLTAPLGLTSARWQILGAIEEAGQALTVPQIGRRMGLSRQGVQRIVNDLHALGFVSLEENPDHKRAKLVALTPSSVEVLVKLNEIQAHWVNELAKSIPEVELKQAVALLNKVSERIAEME